MTVQLWVVAIDAPDECQIAVTFPKAGVPFCAVEKLTLPEFEGMNPVLQARTLTDLLAVRSGKQPAPRSTAPAPEPLPWEQPGDPGPVPDMDGPLPLGDDGQWGYDGDDGFP